MSTSILLLNKCIIINYQNNTNNDNSDKNSSNDSNSKSDEDNENDSYAKITYMLDELGMLVNYKTKKYS